MYWYNLMVNGEFWKSIKSQVPINKDDILEFDKQYIVIKRIFHTNPNSKGELYCNLYIKLYI